jgi:hypothetical protein
MTNLELTQKKTIEQQQLQIDEMRELASWQGFYDFYFKRLNLFRTNADCFEFVNQKYYDYFGEFRYSTHESFVRAIRRYYNDKNKKNEK